MFKHKHKYTYLKGISLLHVPQRNRYASYAINMTLPSLNREWVSHQLFSFLTILNFADCHIIIFFKWFSSLKDIFVI